MKQFKHLNASSLEEASAALAGGRASVIAGGTDLLGILKDNVLPKHPSTVVNIKSIPGLDYIKEEGGELRIGAATRLADIAEHPAIAQKYTALAQAADSVATPHIRNMGTIGGNIAQLPRCWYFRKLDDRFHCLRKGGRECFAILGDNRYHSIFGGLRADLPTCSRCCPAGTDIGAYMSELRDGDWDKAACTIMKANPMPAITSRVCARFCEQGCNRCLTDEGVAVHGVESALGDYILENSDKFYAPPKTETGKSIAVIGSGPAGLAAAYYLRRAGHSVTAYDGKAEAGGLLMSGIPEDKLPRDIVRRFVAALETMGVIFRLGAELGEAELLGKYDSVLYAGGKREQTREGVFTAVNVSKSPGTVIGAVAGGRRASEEINRYLGVPECTSADAAYISHDAQGVTNVKAITFSQTPTRDEAVAEARRCMNCGCYAVHPSDVAPALIALDAKVVTTKRTLDAEELFAVKKPGNTCLECDELITELRIPAPAKESASAFKKFALRKAIDFAVVNCAVVTGETPRICLGAVAPVPYRATQAEALVAGKAIDEALAEAAGEAAVASAAPLSESAYKVQIAKTLVKRTLLAAAEIG